MVAIVRASEFVIGMAVGPVALESSSWPLDLWNKNYYNRKDQVESLKLSTILPLLAQKNK